MQQNLFLFFYHKKLELLEPQKKRNRKKGTAKAIPKIGKICILYIYKEYLLCLNSNASGRLNEVFAKYLLH